jgi:hypothetical protein
MNKILNNKINSNLIRIISLYTLPLLLNSSYIEQLLNHLIISTFNIEWSLTSGQCYNNSENDINLYDLKNKDNYKIRYLSSEFNDWWTIRKC